MEKRGAWVFNDVQRSEVLRANREMMWSHVGWRASASLIGFKEVRWAFHKDLADVDFLLDLFPCAKVLLSYRTDIEVQARSGFWATRNINETKILQEITRANEALFSLHKRRPDNTRLAPLDSLKDVVSLQAHLDWAAGLGEMGCSVTAVPWANAQGRLDRHLSDRCEVVGGCTADPDYVRRYLNCGDRAPSVGTQRELPLPLRRQAA